MFQELREDYGRYSTKRPTLTRMAAKAVANAGFRAVVLYRFGHRCRKRRLRVLAALVERLMHHLCHCWISTTAEIGSGFLIAHVCGLVIGGGTILGRNCDVRHNVTFGGNFNKQDAEGRQFPTLGDNVSVSTGAVLLGPIRIGSNSVIGANSVVTRDVPENVIAAGNPARVLKERWNEEERKL